MSKRPKYRAEDFPAPGTVFAASTRDGRWAAGRVLRRQCEGGAQAALIATSRVLSKELPLLEAPAVRETLILSHHRWKNQPCICWVWDLMPADFVVIGQIPLSAEDRAAASNSFGGWQEVPLHALQQWRWDHEREALLQDEARLAAEEQEARRQRAERRAEAMRTLSLDTLAARTWFPSWEGSVSASTLGECRSLLAQLVSELRAAPKLTLGLVKKQSKQSVEAFNRLDAEQHFISTIEREELCEAYEQIVCAAKFPQVMDQIEQWRNW